MRGFHFSAIIIATGLALLGCSGASSNPAAPPTDQSTTAALTATGRSQTHLWGYYDVYIDVPTKTVTATENRQAAFTANVVNFLNSKAAALGFHINSTPVGADYVDVDIDVSMTHPFPGLPQYNGYDVRGVFMGDGSASLNYNLDLIYPVLGFDQFMLADPVDGMGGPDGYTRWFNKPEFSEGGMPLFQYTQGKAASAGFAGTATLNPYKYFADGLGATQDLWSWLKDHGGQHGVFSSGAINTRNYYLRFPNSKGIKFGYAVTANWAGEAPQFHPSNTPEAVALNVTDNSDLFYIDYTNSGGTMKLDIGVWDWDSVISGGKMDDYSLYVESTVLQNPYKLNALEMTPTGGGEHFSTYHVEIIPDNIQGTDGNEYWVIVEQKGHDYTNSFGVLNLAGTDALAAFFRYDLEVGTNASNHPPVCDLQLLSQSPIDGWDAGVPMEFDASGSSDPDGDPFTYSWDFDGDGKYNEVVDDSIDAGTPDKPTHYYKANFNGKVCVRLNDGKGGKSECCVSLQVTVHQSKNVPLWSGSIAKDIAVDPSNGTLLVLYSNAQIWKYPLSKWYTQSSGSFFMTSISGVSMLDVSPKSYLVVASGPATIDGNIFNYDPAGNFLGGYWTWFAGPVRDVSTFPDSGNYADYHCLAWGYNNGTYIDEYSYPNFVLPNQHYIAINPPYTGYSVLNGDWVRGIECVTDALWAVETNDYYAGRFRLVPYSFNYDGAYVGTGAQTEADNGFYEPQDMTIDSNGRLFILDKTSTGAPKIKVFASSGEPGASLGSFGNTTNISGDPLKIEGSSYVDPNLGNMIVVLHGSGAPSMVSVFLPNEMP